MTPVKNCALYLRVSTEDQARDGTSLDTQKAALVQYAKANGWKVYETYSDDGISGATLDRPALNRLRDDAKAGKFTTIFVYKTDRLARNLRLLLNLVQGEFEPSGVGMMSITEPYETQSPAGKLMFALLGGFAEHERSQIAERSTRGRRHKAGMGYAMSVLKPFGYLCGKDGKWAIDEAEEKTYKLIVDLYVNKGLSTHGVAERLNKLGIPTKRNASIGWRTSAVKVILKNPRYLGKHTYGGVTCDIPPLIDRAMWDKIQFAMVSRRTWRTQPVVRFYLLRKLLRCSDCGRMFRGINNPGCNSFTYGCGGKHNKDYKSANCRMRNIQRSKADKWIWDCVAATISKPSSIRTIVEQGNVQGTTKTVSFETERLMVESQLKKKRSGIERLFSLFADGKYEESDLNQSMDKLKAETASLEGELKSLNEKMKHQNKLRENRRSVEDMLKAFQPALATLTDEQKREILLKLVDRVEVIYDHAKERHLMQIFYKFQVPEFGFPGFGKNKEETLMTVAKSE